MRVFSDLSIKRKQTLIIMFTSSVALLLTCAVVLTYEAISFRRAMTDQLWTLAEIVGQNSTAALAFNDPTAAKEILSALSAEGSIISACLYAKDGKRVASYLRAGLKVDPSPPQPQEDGIQFKPGRLVLFRRILLDNEKVGSLYMAAGLEQLNARLWRYAGIISLLMGAASLLALLLSSRLQREISEPILHLAQTAKAVSTAKNYSIRAVKHGQDELGVLTDSFNEMLGQIEERDVQLHGDGWGHLRDPPPRKGRPVH